MRFSRSWARQPRPWNVTRGLVHPEYQHLWDGLEGLWPLWFAGSNSWDVSPRSRDGTTAGGLTWTGTPMGMVPDFDGVNDVIDLGTAPSMTNWTLSALVIPDRVSVTTSAAGMNILGNDLSGWNDDVLFGIRPEGSSFGTNNRIGVIHQESTDQLRTISEDTEDAVIGYPYFINAQADGTNLDLFVNGARKASTAAAGADLNYGANQWQIGSSRFPTTSREFEGKILLVAVHSRALADVEIQDWSRNPFGIIQMAAMPAYVVAAAATSLIFRRQSMGTIVRM